MNALSRGAIRSGCVNSTTPAWNARCTDYDRRTSPRRELIGRYDIGAVEWHWQHGVKVCVGGVKGALMARLEALPGGSTET